jgi:hypothetical protein
MSFLLKYWKVLAILLLCLGSFAAGRWATPTPVQTDKTLTIQDTNKHESIEAKNDKVTVITKKPDGSITTTITDHSTVTKTKEESKVAKTTETKKTPVVPDVYRPDYRAGFQVHQPFSTDWKPSYSVESGYRVLGNLWGTASYNTSEHLFGLGVSVDF